MTDLTVHGHSVVTEPCDGLVGYWRVRADDLFVGLVQHDVVGWHTLPVLDGRPRPILHAPSFMLCVAALLAETIDKEQPP